ncbi:hypothetical protein [Tessaracoccus coleopterorum]|uniref:hypothetical protein n=1 Tax=Tessaracoccus coleopterorum TaxID=2714950 RepID=UPI0018D2BA01|nr:hypothetical protein [Tessaracoccus coleopterorum]
MDGLQIQWLLDPTEVELGRRRSSPSRPSSPPFSTPMGATWPEAGQKNQAPRV